MSLIRSQVASNQQWLKFVRASLPADLALHTVDCVLKNNSIIVYTESATWATKLRFHSHRVLTTINRQGLAKTKKMIVRITQSRGQNSSKLRPRSFKRPLPGHIAAIEQSANNTDGNLQKALLKLAKTLRSERKVH